jgi:Cof subfamily protein (haloacid dehalogenase superfamily)
MIAMRYTCGTIAIAVARPHGDAASDDDAREEGSVAERAWVNTTTVSGEPIAVVPLPEQPRGILALDIDGTLLGPGSVLAERTRRAVHAAGEAGWLVTLATGRRWGATKPIADALGLPAPLICFNGALIRDSLDGTILHYNPLPPTVTGPLIRELAGRGLQPVVYEDFTSGERLLTGPQAQDSPQIARWFHALSDEYGPIVSRVEYDELAQVPGASRVVIFDTEERARPLADLAADLALELRALIYEGETRNGLMIEFLHPAGTKAVAIGALAARYGLTLAETIAVGDGHNDLEMLREAGIGVAMGQGSAEVHAAANIVIGTHADDGLAAFIEQELLGGTGFPEHLKQTADGRRQTADG